MTKPFRPMRGIAIDFEKMRYPALMSPKLDGIRGLVTPDGFVSKKLIHIPQPAIQTRYWQPEFNGLEGEIIVGQPTDLDVYNTTQSFVMSKKVFNPNPDFTLWVFDNTLHPDMRFDERINAIEHRIRTIGNPHVKLIPHVVVRSKEEIVAQHDRNLDLGYEGSIIRAPEGLYKYGQSTANEGWMLKFKPNETFDARVVGYYEKEHNGNEATTDNLGHTKRSSHQAGKTGLGTLGGVVAEDLETGEIFRCGIFIGLKAADLKKLWDERETLPGRYFEAIKMGYGQKVKPRHPRWFRWRDAINTELAA